LRSIGVFKMPLPKRNAASPEFHDRKSIREQKRSFWKMLEGLERKSKCSNGPPFLTSNRANKRETISQNMRGFLTLGKNMSQTHRHTVAGQMPKAAKTPKAAQPSAVA
jgi:hypothetical protein